MTLARRGKRGPMILAVAGNTGAGKSTLISMMSARLGQGWKVVPESVDDNPFLVPYGEDPARWGFALQAHFLERRRRAYIESRDLLAEKGPTLGVILDRTLMEGAEIFVPEMLSTGLLTAEEGKLHSRMLSAYGGVSKYAPDLLIYLRRPAAVAHRQVMKRARASDENVISIDFLNDLEKRYDEWFSDYSSGPKYVWDAGEEDYISNPALFEDRFEDLCRTCIRGSVADGRVIPSLRTAGFSGRSASGLRLSVVEG